MPNNGLSIRHECHGYYIAACLGVRFAGVWKQSGGLMDFLDTATGGNFTARSLPEAREKLEAHRKEFEV